MEIKKRRRKGEIDPDHPNLKARVMPNNLEAEQSVLGCVMIDEYAPIHILSELKEDDFYSAAHREIFSAMATVASRDQPIDIVTIVQELETVGKMEEAGGITYLTSLSNLVPSASNFKHYVAIVKKNSVLRKLISAGTRIIDNAFTGDHDDMALSMAEREVYSLSEEQDKSNLRPVHQSINDAIDKMEKLFADPKSSRGIPTPFRGLNAMLNGFQPSDLLLIAARPGQGKTSIAMNFIEHAALNCDRRTAAGKPDPYKCAVFSLEMPAVQLAKRLVCSVAKVNMKNASSGNLTPDEWKRIYDARTRLSKAEIYLDDSSLTTPIEILSKCRRLKREKGLDMIMVDYLQLMSSGGKVESRQQEISEITRTMKIAAKELNVPIILLSQLSREVEKRNVKVPQMSDLRESGAIEQDADIIMFIYREHDPNDQTIEAELRNKAELIIAKHRNGECGRVELRWRGETVSFEDVDKSPAGAQLQKNMPPEEKEKFVNASSEEVNFANADIVPTIPADYLTPPPSFSKEETGEKEKPQEPQEKRSAPRPTKLNVNADEDIF